MIESGDPFWSQFKEVLHWADEVEAIYFNKEQRKKNAAIGGPMYGTENILSVGYKYSKMGFEKFSMDDKLFFLFALFAPKIINKGYTRNEMHHDTREKEGAKNKVPNKLKKMSDEEI